MAHGGFPQIDSSQAPHGRHKSLVLINFYQDLSCLIWSKIEPNHVCTVK